MARSTAGDPVAFMALNTTRAVRPGWLAAAAAASLLQAGCIVGHGEATFSRTLKVNGPVRLEVSTGSGRIVIRNGNAGEVRVSGEVRAGGLFGSSGSRRAAEIASNPPIDQSGNLVRLGGNRGYMGWGNASISYTVETPADTEVNARTGSGDVQISGLREQVGVTMGSGVARLDELGDNLTISLGSGRIEASRIQGSVSFHSGSGQLTFRDVREDVRGSTGSGSIEVDRAHGRVSVGTGTGPIRVDGAMDDLRASTGSGRIEIHGNPGGNAFWDVGAGSGEITLAVPASASLSLTARTSSGDVRVDMPISIEEQTRKFLRARIGDGKAHVNVETKSGNIRIRQGGET